VPPASAAAIKQALLARAAPAPSRPRRPAAAAGRLDAAVAETVLALARRRLGRPSLTLDDNLFAAGLNSLAFVEFVNRVEAATGQRIPLALALGEPTAARLASLAARSGPAAAAAPESLVWLRPGTAGTAALFVHGGFGGVDVYRDLALAWPDGWDVWGLRFDALATPHPRALPIEAIAARYADEVRARFAAGGRLAIVGWSVGGTIAAELALQLAAAYDVDLALLDAIAPGWQVEVGDFTPESERRLVAAHLPAGVGPLAGSAEPPAKSGPAGQPGPAGVGPLAGSAAPPTESGRASQPGPANAGPLAASAAPPTEPGQASQPGPAAAGPLARRGQSVEQLWAAVEAALSGGPAEADFVHALARSISPTLVEDLGTAGRTATVAQFSALRTLVGARNAYVPAGTLPRVLAVRASDGEAANIADWARLAPTGLALADVDGNHYSMMMGDGARAVAAAAAAHLARREDTL
jgi:thioesterase domain-containing protein/acyl carrier protein